MASDFKRTGRVGRCTLHPRTPAENHISLNSSSHCLWSRRVPSSRAKTSSRSQATCFQPASARQRVGWQGHVAAPIALGKIDLVERVGADDVDLGALEVHL